MIQDSLSHLLLLALTRVQMSLSITPYQPFCLAQVNRLCCISLHSQGGGGRGCKWFQWNNGIDLRTPRKQCTSPGWLQELLYLLKILLGLWAVGENFQIATAYTRNCPPIPCLLWCLSHSPSLLLVLWEQCSPGIQNKNNAWPRAFPECNSWEGQDVIVVPWAFMDSLVTLQPLTYMASHIHIMTLRDFLSSVNARCCSSNSCPHRAFPICSHTLSSIPAKLYHSHSATACVQG